MKVAKKLFQEKKLWDNPKLPKIFTYTIYRLPTPEELDEVHTCNLTSEEVFEGFCYTLIGRGIMFQNIRDQIVEAIQMLCNRHPSPTYSRALEKAKALVPKTITV